MSVSDKNEETGEAVLKVIVVLWKIDSRELSGNFIVEKISQVILFVFTENEKNAKPIWY